MKKAVKLFLAAAATLALFAACEDQKEGVKKYTLTVTTTVAAEDQVEGVSPTDLVLKWTKGGKSGTVTPDALSLVEDENTIVVELPQGNYSINVSGVLGYAKIGGQADVELYDDTEISIELKKIKTSSLIFRTIYSCWGIKGYTRDNYFEIVNNSDEVQYLDNVALGCVSGANFTSASAWLELTRQGLYVGDLGGSVVAFPGTGKDYPLQPGEVVVIANDATNHSELAAEGNNCPDLSGADWEIYIDATLMANTKDTDYTDVPNLRVIHFVSNDIWCQSALNGGVFMFRLPEGQSLEDFAADENNLMTTPGTSATTQYLMIPSQYVLDAVSLYNPAKDRSTIFPFFASWDEADGVDQATQFSGKGVRRKVISVENGIAKYKDTNNSFEDFLTNVTMTPRQAYTEVDVEIAAE